MAKKKINSRTKGQTAERKLVKLFKTWWGSDFFRTPGSGAFATLGFNSKEVNLAGDICTLDPSFPFCVESKKVEGWTLEQMLTSDKTLMHKWWEQTVNETPKGMIPLLVFTKNRAPLYAMMWGDDVEGQGIGNVFFSYPLQPGSAMVCIFALEHLFKTEPPRWLISREPLTEAELDHGKRLADHKVAEQILVNFPDPAKLKPSSKPHPRWPRF